MDFSETGYGSLLRTFQDAGYQFLTFRDAGQGAVPAQTVLWRHDVDMCLVRAMKMAQIEAEAKIQSTYFVLLTSPLYNAMTATSMRCLQQILELGHEIGLHFDLTAYADPEAPLETERLEDAIQQERVILQNITGQTVASLSFHRPIKALLGYQHQLGGLAHAYEPRFFSDIAYSSDSQGAWRFGLPTDHAAFAERAAMQVLTHPIWWISGQGDPVSTLDNLVSERHDNYQQDLMANCIPYRTRQV